MKYNLQHCIGSRLRRLSRITDAHFRSLLADFDITENQMTILFALSEMGKVEQGRIGLVLALERSTVSRNVKLLEKQKYVVRTADYRPEIELSQAGKELVQTLIPLWEKTMDELVLMLGKDGLAHLEVLEKRIE